MVESNWLGRLQANPEQYAKAVKLARLSKDEGSTPLVRMLAMAELYDLMAPFINPSAEVVSLRPRVDQT